MGFIKNTEQLATTPLRKDALALVEAGLAAIDTQKRLQSLVTLCDGVLRIGDQAYPLADFKSVHIIGFGKASARAAQTLESILGDYLTGGIALDKTPLICKRVQVYAGSHPMPTARNVEVTEKIATLANSLTEDDLAIVVVSGGGSSLLCWPLSECDQGAQLYEAFLKAGGTIKELNTLRKHLSGIKGGGLAQLLYPAHVAALIFCDVPGDDYETVASGPTYYDHTTVADAQALVERYKIEGTFEFVETPKDAKYFERVANIPVVSNLHALSAVIEHATHLGYQVHSLGAECYDDPLHVLRALLAHNAPQTLVIGAGEPHMKIAGPGGIGGRNEYMAALMIDLVPSDTVFVSCASDGIDNCSAAAGGIVDTETKTLAVRRNLQPHHYIDGYQHDELLKLLGAQIITGPTESNVSDFFFIIHS